MCQLEVLYSPIVLYSMGILAQSFTFSRSESMTHLLRRSRTGLWNSGTSVETRQTEVQFFDFASELKSASLFGLFAVELLTAASRSLSS